jgi:hypothetical protein
MENLDDILAADHKFKLELEWVLFGVRGHFLTDLSGPSCTKYVLDE